MGSKKGAIFAWTVVRVMHASLIVGTHDVNMHQEQLDAPAIEGDSGETHGKTGFNTEKHP